MNTKDVFDAIVFRLCHLMRTCVRGEKQ